MNRFGGAPCDGSYRWFQLAEVAFISNGKWFNFSDWMKWFYNGYTPNRNTKKWMAAEKTWYTFKKRNKEFLKIRKMSKGGNWKEIRIP